MINQGLFQSTKQDWGTPQDFFDEINKEFDFELDVASNGDNAKCERYYTPVTDGLSSPWRVSPGKSVFCNPPYGRELPKWVKKAFEESRSGTKIVLLIPARTDTSYFHDYIYGKAEIRFIRGRMRFEDCRGKSCGTAPFPSMLVIYN
ncbi:MAG TPA: adenine methyltransferase [Candidatus Onthovicinus excrementipullorum]|nr:adenine methyltransferase [Candidatus Onthovicinus excrementipullorum]